MEAIIFYGLLMLCTFASMLLSYYVLWLILWICEELS